MADDLLAPDLPFHHPQNVERRLRDEIERLRAEVASYKDAMEPRIRSLDAGDGGVRMDLEGGACRLLAEWLADEYKRNSGINYIESRFTSHEAMPGEAFVVTVQRVNGKTPHQLRQDAERELAALRDRIASAPVRDTYVEGEHGRELVWLSDDGAMPAEYKGKRVRLVVEPTSPESDP